MHKQCIGFKYCAEDPSHELNYVEYSLALCTRDSSAVEFIDTVETTIEQLRQANHLVARDPNDTSKFWIFRFSAEEDEGIDPTTFMQESTGSISYTVLLEYLRGTGSVTTDQLVELFFDAFTAFTHATLSTIGKVQQIGFLTWLLATQDESHDCDYKHPSASPNLQVKIVLRTTSCGSIVMVTEIRQSALQSMRESTAEGTPVLLSPIGLSGHLVKKPAPLRDPTLADEAWIMLLQKIPFLRQLSWTGRDQNWVTIETNSKILEDDTGCQACPPHLLWPACLCLTECAMHDADTEMKLLGPSFAAVNFEDPLKQAETWFNGAADREKKLAARDRTVQAENNVLDRLEDDMDLAPSPLQYRTVDAGITNAVYPTPPDGIATVHNPPTSSSLTAVELRSDEDLAGQDNSSQVPNQVTQEQDSDLQPIDADNLFREMEDDMFGHPDVTDADFNFFEDDGGAAAATRTLAPSKHEAPDLQEEEEEEKEEPKIMHCVEKENPAGTLRAPFSGQTVIVTRKSALRDPGNTDNSTAFLDRGVTTPPLSPLLVKGQLKQKTAQLSGSELGLASMKNHDFAPVPFQGSVLNTSKYRPGGRFGGRDDLPDFSQGSSKRNISLREFLEHHISASSGRPRGSFISKTARSELSDDTDESGTNTTTDDSNQIRSPKRQAIFHLEDGRSNPEEKPSRTFSEPQERACLQTLDTVTCNWNNVRSSKTTVQDADDISSSEDQIKSLSRSSESHWTLFDLDRENDIAIAQLITSCSFVDLAQSSEQDDGKIPLSALLIVRNKCLLQAAGLTSMRILSLSSLAGLGSNVATAGSELTTRGGPRPTPRRTGPGPTFGQQLFPLSAPFLRLRRGDSQWDMLSSASIFWEALGLGPTHGPKDVSAEIITVGNDDVKAFALQLVQDIQSFYETFQFGSHVIGLRVHRKIVPLGLDEPGKQSSLDARILQALQEACADLAKRMNLRARSGSQQSVVYLFNPFSEQKMIKYVCACFQLCLRSLSTEVGNVALQLVPLQVFTGHGGVVVPQTIQIQRLCLTTYDKLLPLEPESSSPWKLFCAPAIALVSPLPRKINFALNENPPINLMQEAQVIHLGYAISGDGRWVNVAWTDYTGNHQAHYSYCLYRADKQAVFNAVKDFTNTLVAPNTAWRIIIACVGHSSADERQIFSALNASNVAVTMVDVCLTPHVQIYPQQVESDPNATMPTTPALVQPGANFTPASTPQAASTVSPDGHYPQTPSSSDPMSAVQSQPPEPDPDAHLVDTRDESFALVLPFSVSRSPYSTRHPQPQKRALGSGQLLKRGDAIPGQALPSLGVDVMEVYPPKIAPGQPNWMMQRAPEYILREVLAWYRGLGLLGKVRGIKGCENGERPWHVGVVVQMCESLEGFFD